MNMREITVTAYNDEAAKYSPLNIQAIPLDSGNTYASFNLCDVLQKVDGVSMLSTGLAIAKPVIRGLYGNRVLVLLNGLKFDNQQWQEEHRMGLTSFGLGKVELIKGPIGILYGTDAIGGVINIIEEQKPAKNTSETDVQMSLNSNTQGGMLQAGYKIAKDNKWWRVRVGADNNADYTDGNNTRVLNSRFDGYYFKATYGFERKNWVQENNFLSSYNRYGFIFNDIYNFVKPDAKESRRLNVNPAHLVLLNILSSENKIKLCDKLNLDVNVGLQSNERMENEGGGNISLNMHLFTMQSLAKLAYTINERHKIIFSNLNSFEDNTNFGARKIVPDANMQEHNLSVNYEINLAHWVIENGAGVGEKWIKTYFTSSVNGQGKEVQPFNKSSPYYNVFSGVTFFPNNHFNFKANVATGVRVANLAELSSNGLHEGVFTYEIGNPNLKNEQIYSANLYANYERKWFTISLSSFYNYFNNYIYLTPIAEQWFGFPVYRYKQQNATQYGTEFSVTMRPSNDFDIKCSYSGMISKTEDGNYTPYIPAQKIVPSLQYRFATKNKMNFQCYTNLQYCLAQNNVAPNEIKTPQYSLWNTGISTRFAHKKTDYSITITCNNILNTAYYDHLSRFKNYGLLNMGRNIVLNFKIKI